MTATTGVKKIIKLMPVLLLAFMLAIVSAIPAMAASRTKITAVKVTITEDDITPETRYGTENIEVDVDSGHYSFDYYEIDDDGVEWRVDQVPRITIHLVVDDPDLYYFSSTLKNNFTVSGATYVTGTLTTAESATELYFTVELTPMNERVADMTTVTLTDSGYAYWDAPVGAGSYELRVYRNGSLDGTTDIKTDATEYNLKDHMNKAGDYYVRVRACNGINPANKSEWIESSTVSISAERANEIREGIPFTRPLAGDWENVEGGQVYRYEDGSVAGPGWVQFDNYWYYFDENGIMQTGWITVDGLEYYMDNRTGRMLTNTTTPDGYKLDENGNKKTD